MNQSEIETLCEKLKAISNKEGIAVEEIESLNTTIEFLKLLFKRVLDDDDVIYGLGNAKSQLTLRINQLEDAYEVLNQKIVGARNAFKREQSILESSINEIGEKEQDGTAKELALKLLRTYSSAAMEKLNVIKDVK